MVSTETERFIFAETLYTVILQSHSGLQHLGSMFELKTLQAYSVLQSPEYINRAATTKYDRRAQQ